MGLLSKRKGKRGELEAARELGNLLGADVSRSQQYKGGQHSADLAGAGSLHTEVKRCERLSLYAALDQATNDAGEDKTPIVLHRRNRRQWVAIVWLDDLADVAEAVMSIKAQSVKGRYK